MAGGPPSGQLFSGKSVWIYPPTLALAIIGAVLFGLVTAYLTYLTVFRYRTWYFLCAVLGAIVETAGFIVRCYSTQNQSQLVRCPRLSTAKPSSESLASSFSPSAPSPPYSVIMTRFSLFFYFSS